MSKNKCVDFQPLSVGGQGTMIYVVQKILNQMGYELEEDGKFSEEMERAVKSFQETRESLSVDGVIDYHTMKEIDELSKQD